jgi:glycosyltransferase involved in cell wall biosynthesis
VKRLLRHIAKRKTVRRIGRILIPRRIREKIDATFTYAGFRFPTLPPPTAADFSFLLSETKTLDCVPAKVVVVCGSLQPGGAERQVANTLIGLKQRGLQNLTLLCDFLQTSGSHKYDFYLPVAQTSGAEIRIVRNSWKAAEIPIPAGLAGAMKGQRPALDRTLVQDIANLYFEFRTLRPQIVHAWLDWSNVRAGLAALLAGVPHVILSGRNLSPRHFLLNTNYFLPSYSAILAKGAGRVTLINNSQAGAADYANWLSVPSSGIPVIRNGVHFGTEIQLVAAESGRLREKFGIPPNAPVLGGMFRFAAEKRPLTWLQVAARVSASLPDVHFMLFGEGPMFDEMMDAVRKLGLQNRLHFCGVITPAAHALSACNAVLLTSSGEGTPNVLLEAQWLGLPVITTDAGGASEAVLDGVTGHVVRSGDEAEIAHAVVKVLCDGSLQENVRERGPLFIEERYGMERMISETLALYGAKLRKSGIDMEVKV